MEKKKRDQNELCAKLQEYSAIARERDEWKKKFEDLQIAHKEEEIKHLKELFMARVSQVSPEVLATMNSSEASSSEPEKYNTRPLRHLSRSSVPGVVQSGSQSSYERDQ